MADGTRWQPILLILSGERKRLECACGAIAMIISGEVSDPQDKESPLLEGVGTWCQSCFVKAQEEGEA